MTITLLLPLLFVFSTIIFKTKKTRGIDCSFMSIDITNILRGVAILLVILMHASCGAGQRMFTPLGGIGVALFLILSGYGLTISYKRNGINHFWKKKVSRIFIPYALLLFAVIIIKSDYERLFSIDFLLDLMCLKTSYWYIAFLVYNYILFWVCNIFKMNALLKYSLFAVFGLCLILFDYRIRAEQALSFASGMIIADYKTLISAYINQHKKIVLIGLFAIVALSCKQIPDIRELIEQNYLVQNIIELVIKFGFAMTILLLFNFTPPYAKRLYAC